MPTITTVNVTSKSPPTLIIGAQGGTVATIQIVNLDTTNTVYVGNTSNLIIGQPGVFPLGPLASMSFDGTKPVYGITLGPTVVVGLIPGGSNYSPGSLAIAGSVNATVSGNVNIANTPTVNLSGGTTIDVAGNVDVIGSGGTFPPGSLSNLFNSGNVTVPASTTTAITSGPVSVASYASIVLTAQDIANSSVAAGAAVCAIIHIIWQDSLSAPIAEDTVSILCTSGANQATWEIPCKGNTFTMQVQNIGTVGSLAITNSPTISIDGSYRIVPAMRALQSSLSSAGLTLTGCTVSVQTVPIYSILGWIASIAATWTTAAIVVVPLPQWVGPVSGTYQVTTSVLAHVGTIVDLTYAVQGGVVAGTAYANGIVNNYPAAVGQVPVNFNSLGSQLAFVFQGTTTAGSVSLALTGESS
jgi:hypothetical protein